MPRKPYTPPTLTKMVAAGPGVALSDDAVVQIGINGLAKFYRGSGFPGFATEIEQGKAEHNSHVIAARIALSAAAAALSAGAGSAAILPDNARRNEQRTICEACGNSNLAASRAKWTEDGSSFCPSCSPVAAGEADLPDDDEPKNYRDLAEAAIMDMRAYAEDETSARRMVSVRAYEDRLRLLDGLIPLPAPPAEPVAYLKEWTVDGLARRRVDLFPECEPWLASLNPTVTKLYK